MATYRITLEVEAGSHADAEWLANEMKEHINFGNDVDGEVTDIVGIEHVKSI